MTKKSENVYTTPEALVNFYTLDAPFGKTTAEFDEKGMVTNGKLAIRVELDPTLPETKELLKNLKGNKSIKEVVKDGKVLVQMNAGTKFKVSVGDAEGRIIDAPSDVRINNGDIMKVTLSVSPYNYEFEGKKGSALRLNAVKILSHDTTKRVEVEAKEGTGKASFLDALNQTTDNLAKLKG